MGSNELRALVEKQQWFQELVQKHAMELLNTLLTDEGESVESEYLEDSEESDTPDQGGEGGSDGGKPYVVEETVSADSSHPKRAGGFVYKWHTSSGNRFDRRHMFAVGPKGIKLEAVRSTARSINGSSSAYWWLALVNGDKVGRCFTLRDAKLTAEYAVSKI